MGNILSSLKITLKSLFMTYLVAFLKALDYGQPAVLPDMSIVWWET